MFITTVLRQAKNVSTSSYQFCINHVKKYDRENYLAALYIQDPSIRRAVYALRAFNVDLSLVKDSTTNIDRAKLRFHFWSKLVDEILRRNIERTLENKDKLTAYYNYSPIAKELLDLFFLVELDCDKLNNLKDLIGSRVSSKILGYRSFDSMSELELYCSKSNSSLYRLATSIALKINNDTAIESTTSVLSEKLGVAQGLSNILRGYIYNASKGCCYIPKEVLDEYSLTHKDTKSRSVTPAIKKLASRCQDALDEVSLYHKEAPLYVKQILLPRVAIQAYLRNLKKCDYDLFDPKLNRRNDLLPLNLWFHSLAINKGFR